MNHEDERDYAEEAANAELLRNPDPEPVAEIPGQLITVQIRWMPGYPDSDGFIANMAEFVRDRLVSVAELFTEFQEHAYVTSHIREFKPTEQQSGKQFISPRGDS